MSKPVKTEEEKRLSAERKRQSNENIIGRNIFLFLLLRYFGYQVILMKPKRGIEIKEGGTRNPQELDIKTIIKPDGKVLLERSTVKNEEKVKVKQHISETKAGKPENTIRDENTRTLRKNIYDRINNFIINHIKEHLSDYIVQMETSESKACDKQKGKEKNIKLESITIQTSSGNRIRIDYDNICSIGLEWLNKNYEQIRKLQGTTFEITDTYNELEQLLISKATSITVQQQIQAQPYEGFNTVQPTMILQQQVQQNVETIPQYTNYNSEPIDMNINNNQVEQLTNDWMNEEVDIEETQNMQQHQQEFVSNDFSNQPITTTSQFNVDFTNPMNVFGYDIVLQEDYNKLCYRANYYYQQRCQPVNGYYYFGDPNYWFNPNTCRLDRYCDVVQNPIVQQQLIDNNQ